MAYDRESHLVTDVIKYLLVLGIPAWRNNSGMMPVLNPTTRKRYLIRLGESGSPDVIGVLPPDGRFLGVECKRVKKIISNSQKKFRDTIEAVGGLYLVVNDPQELDEMLSEGQ